MESAAVLVPPARYFADLRMIRDGYAWKVSTLRLEFLIQGGFVNATGTKVTDNVLNFIK
jgi:hypothetical protein